MILSSGFEIHCYRTTHIPSREISHTGQREFSEEAAEITATHTACGHKATYRHGRGPGMFTKSIGAYALRCPDCGIEGTVMGADLLKAPRG